MMPFVLLVSHGFQPSYEKAFANGLAVNETEVELIASDRTLVAELDTRVRATNLRGSQEPTRSAFAKAANLIRYALALFGRIRSGRHDVVHLIGLFMTRNQLAGLLECVCYRILAQRFFITVHNLLPHNRHTTFNRLLYRALYRLPDRLVVHTEKMKSGLTDQFGVSASRIVVMQHGVDELPRMLRVPEPGSVFRLVLFGGLSPYKGADLLLQALRQIQDIETELVIAGECRDVEYAEQIEQLVRTLGTNHTVRWDRRFVAEHDVGSYFESADVAVLPYRHIDQSGVLFTAYRFGTPVIATDVGAFRDYLPEYAGMLVSAVSATALAQTLRAFHARAGEFDRQRIRLYAQSMEWPKTVRPLVEAYTKARNER